MYIKFVKRAFDVVFASSMLLLLSPLLVLVCLAILATDGKPVLFRQMRAGCNGRPFTIFKFRSMTVASADIPSALASGRVKVTGVGKVIRRTNIDELPQLLNILQGTMSVVGPRPCLPQQRELLDLRRTSGALTLVPGLTGLAQINSFDGMSERAVASWDQRYFKHLSFGHDLKIIVLTFRYCFQRPPIY